MYTSRYSSVPKHSPTVQKKMQYPSKGKSCGYYLRIIFFFSSLIQSLIIVSLVLFLIYGNKQDSASLSRIQDLEESFSRLSIENVALKKQRTNLTTLLNSTLTEKARNDWELVRLRYYSNVSLFVLRDIDKAMQQCNTELIICKTTPFVPPGQFRQVYSGICDCGMLVRQMKARIELLEANCTQTSQKLKREMDQIAKDRDNLNLEAIALRRDKAKHEKEAELCKKSCKTEFVQSLSGISNVTTAFLNKIDSLFSTHMPFHLTCQKQRDHLDRIQFNCTNLSREVEQKFQHYLNSVGDQVSTIQAENNRLKAENWRLLEDYRSCSQTRQGLSQQHKENINRLQEKHDQVAERLLIEKNNLNGEIMVLNKTVDYKNREVAYLAEQLKQLNLTCMSRAYASTPYAGPRTSINSGWNIFRNSGAGTGGAGGSSSSSSSYSNSPSHNSRPGTASSSVYSGMSSSSSSSSSSSGSTSSTSSSSSSSSGGTSNTKPGSTGGLLSFLGSNPSSSSSGSSLSKSGLTGRSSTINPGGSSDGTNPGLLGQGAERATTNTKGSNASSSSSSSTSRSSPFSWFGTRKGPSGEREDGAHPAKQHILDLERLVNPDGSRATQ